MKLLFICNQNLHRSKTAAQIFSHKYQTKSAGLFNTHSVDKKTLTWADKIFVMEERQRKIIAERFPKEYLQKQILNLNIPDIYNFNDSKLVKSLKQKISNLI
tara:strand:- start:4872 stop:5177 length:306 start_codon:yes stop_codon:yes gene_type:complete